MMGKKDYLLFAEVISQIEDETNREKIIDFLCDVFSEDNALFDPEIFEEWVRERKQREKNCCLEVA